MVQFQTGSGDLGAAGAHDYGLPPLPQLPCPETRGPTPWSNWVLRGRLLAGAYPASLDDAETERILTTLLELGVNTFVCLQAEFSLHTPESAWRAGQGLRPYIKDAQKLLIRARESGSRRILQDKLDFLHLPIIDGSVTSDTALSRLADDCCTRILRGERLYVHCWGGHGRTGTLIAVMLGRLYGLTCASALRFTQAFHDSRKFPQGVRSPQTTPQVAQVKRLLPDPPSVRGVAYPRDSSIVLDDTILRPGSAASTRPGTATCAPVITAVPAAKPITPQAVPSPPPARGGTAPAAAAGDDVAAEVAAELETMDIDEAPAHFAAPVNQQRKDAIRAGTVKQPSGMAAAEGASALAAALQAAGLQSRPAGNGGAAIPAVTAPAERQRDWLQSVFGKALARQAQTGANGGAGGIGAAPAVPASAPQPKQQPDVSPHLRHAGYLQQYVQQQNQQQQRRLSGGLGKAGVAGGTIFLTASSGSAAGALVSAVTAVEDSNCPALDAERLDMRPSQLTVAVPAAEPASPERSSSSMQRMRNYLTGQRSAAGLTK